jgi:hypothetical protein
MKTKHQIELTHQELRDVCEAMEFLLHEDYALWGGLEHSIKVLVGEELVKAKAKLDRHLALRNSLRDQEFDIWKRELDDEHDRADAEESARYANHEPEEI